MPTQLVLRPSEFARQYGKMRNAETAIFNCVRLYNRNLTAAEVRANYEIEKLRFGLP